MTQLSLKNITTFLFDLDGTLRENVPSRNEVFWKYAAELGAPSDRQAHRNSILWAQNYWGGDGREVERDIQKFGELIDNEAFWAHYTIQRLLSLGCSNKLSVEIGPKVQEFMSEKYKPEDIIPEDVAPTLTAIKNAGYKMGLVTNRSNPVDEYLVEKNLAPYFDFTLTAGEIGVWKPKPGIFHHALTMADSKPEQTIYIGDNYFADIEGAQGVQMQAILIDPQGYFPDANCLVIDKLGDLLPFLNGNHSS